jgi:hypothetical protein
VERIGPVPGAPAHHDDHVLHIDDHHVLHIDVDVHDRAGDDLD